MAAGWPDGLAFDAAGNLYVADWASNTISEVTPGGVVSTFLGNRGRLSGPGGLAFDAAGNFYVANAAGSTISEIGPRSPTEGQAFSNVAVFHFTDADPAATVGDYTAVVTLGDGNAVTLTSTPSDNGQIVANPSGGFDVQISHTYAEELTNQTFSVQIYDNSNGRTISDPTDAATGASTNTFSVTDARLSPGTLGAGGGVEGVTATSLSTASHGRQHGRADHGLLGYHQLGRRQSTPSRRAPCPAAAAATRSAARPSMPRRARTASRSPSTMSAVAAPRSAARPRCRTRRPSCRCRPIRRSKPPTLRRYGELHRGHRHRLRRQPGDHHLRTDSGFPVPARYDDRYSDGDERRWDDRDRHVYRYGPGHHAARVDFAGESDRRGDRAQRGGGCRRPFTAGAVDLVDGADPVHYFIGNTEISSTYVFPLDQSTTVTVTSTDAHDNTASGAFTVVVQDTTPPTLSAVPNQTLEATSPAGAVAVFSATATDVVDGSDPVTLRSPAARPTRSARPRSATPPPTPTATPPPAASPSPYRTPCPRDVSCRRTIPDEYLSQRRVREPVRGGQRLGGCRHLLRRGWQNHRNL